MARSRRTSDARRQEHTEPLKTQEMPRVPARDFRANLARIQRAGHVVAIGGQRTILGIFIPLKLGWLANDYETLKTARRALSKAKSIDRPRSINH
jgi:hypothetical protein